VYKTNYQKKLVHQKNLVHKHGSAPEDAQFMLYSRTATPAEAGEAAGCQNVRVDCGRKRHAQAEAPGTTLPWVTSYAPEAALPASTSATA